MASSSSSPTPKYKVFLSFRGEDTRKGFVSHLYKDLVRLGIRTFKDDKDIPKGRSIPRELPQAIRESKSAVVVISRNYASSRWCLDELLEIVRCKENRSLTIFPVFYGVYPSHVKNQRGPFAKSFLRHKDEWNVDPEKLTRWKGALTKVATIEEGKASQDWAEESGLIDKLVCEINNCLASTTSEEFSDLVGMEDHMENLCPLLDLKSTKDVRMVGIWGMPGIGKTALARYVYHTISCQFDAHCFMEDVKKCHGEERLQKKLLSKILGIPLTPSSQVHSNVIKERLGQKKVLIVIDDVDKIEQLNILAKDTDWFGPGSRIVVTVQDKHLLVAHGVEQEHVYKVECLNSDKARQLFKLSAINPKQPFKGFAKFSFEATKYAEGLPLALTVIGSELRGRSEEECERLLCELKGPLLGRIGQVLRVSYGELDEPKKHIFQLVACLFDGGCVEDVRKLSDNHESGIDILAEKSLIDICNGSIRMHGLLQKMGKGLAQRKLLTDPEEICNALSNKKVNKEIKGISLDLSLTKKMNLPIDGEGFEKMRNLKFLKIYNHVVNDESAVHLAITINLGGCQLKYLSWDSYPLRTLQFQLNSLVVLKMQGSKLEKFLESSQLRQSCLKRIDLQHSENLIEILDLSWAPNLECLDVSYCKRLTKISSTKGLNKNVEVRYIGCSKLERLRSNIILRSLQDFCLAACEKLNRVPLISRTIRLPVKLICITVGFDW